MKTVIALLFSFVISLLVLRLIKKRWEFSLSGRIAMSVMLLFTTLGHFMFTKGMTYMIPDFIPAKEFWVYFTAVLELLAAIGLLLPKTYRITGICLIVFFIMIHIANINSALHHVNMETGESNGPGPEYLYFRIPLQFFFIFWTYWFAVRK